ncbi:hypothetical protein [Actinomadura roseirufa]|uniref:hypothetical protein n=1 Tax=Actinomadura roseirufa TaxID=2094049 RepID=UPI0010419FD5|nr:hypothetical protein [Actinomadura roseirufa]
MSGAKRISVDEREWNQARKAARRLRQVQRDLPGMLEGVRRQNQADIDRAVGAVARRQDRMDGALRGLSRYTRDLEERTSRRLREQAEGLAELGEETRERARRLRAEITAERADREREIQRLDERVTDLKAGRDEASARARATFEDARIMHRAVLDLPHERFAPGRLDRLAHRLADVGETLRVQEGAYSLGRVQDIYLDLSDLRTEVQLAEQEWRLAQAEALGALRGIAARAQAREEVTVMDADGTPLAGAHVDVDFWTDGGLRALRAEIAERTRTAGDPDSPLTVAELRAVVREQAPGFEERLDGLVERAGGRFYASQQRANTADRVIGALEVQGYALVEETYAGEDFREAHYSKVRHLGDDNEIVVEIAPEGDTGMAIRLLSYDDDRSETRRVQRADDMLAVLRRDGVPVGRPTDLGVEPAPEDRDFGRLRARRADGGAGAGAERTRTAPAGRDGG